MDFIHLQYTFLDCTEALMIEPTETESKETLDEFASALEGDCKGDQNKTQILVKGAPYTRSVGRLDEVASSAKTEFKMDYVFTI